MFFGKGNWFVQMVNAIPVPNLPVLNFAYHLPNPWTDRFAHVNGKQSILSGSIFNTRLSPAPMRFFRATFLDAFSVPSWSMEQTMKSGFGKKLDVSKELETYVKLHVHFFSNISNYRRQRSTLEMSGFFLQIFSTCILITKFLSVVEFHKITSASHQSLLLVTQHVSMTGGDIKKQAFFAQANRTISFWVPTYSDIKWNWNNIIEKNEKYKKCVQHAIRSGELKREN